MQDFKWAVNKTKLAQARADLTRSGIAISEESLKTAYLHRAGLLLEDQEAQAQVKKPKVTANKGQKVSQ